MRIRPKNSTENLVLAQLWLRSVSASHHFLSEQDIAELYPQVRDSYLDAVQVWVYADAADQPLGFIGLDEQRVEMLFIDADQRGLGIGRQLLDFAATRHPHLEVDVNQQNPQALQFYQHYGFSEFARSPCDSAGRPFPLIHLRR